MDTQEPKPIPWDSLQDYLKVHDNYIVTLLKMDETKLLKREEIEAKLPNSFKELHKKLTAILALSVPSDE